MYELALCEWQLGETRQAERRRDKLVKADQGFGAAREALECLRLGWLPVHEI